MKSCAVNQSGCFNFCYRLVDTLDAFLECNNLTPIPRFAEEFPDSITLAQTVAVWKHIIQLQERQKRDSV